MSVTRLVISEMFASIQGEGASAGRPAIFLRLAACNLQCPGFSYKAPGTQQHLGCDTKLVWQQGKVYGFDEMLALWQSQGWFEKFLQGAHLVITGGEPLLQQERLSEFIQLLDASHPQSVFIEVETNATLTPNEFLQQRINQFNVSPKLLSSGEPREKTYKFETLQVFAKLSQANFKFVVQYPEDVQEIKLHYQAALNLPPSRIWLMPEGGSLRVLQSHLPWVAECCIENNYNFSPRLHIHIWDEATGK